MNVYEQIPVFEGKNFCLRGIMPSDAEDLLQVYSDEKAVPFFNSDNCHGDNFHYTTIECVHEAIRFWLWSYENRYFVRWSIIKKKKGTAVGTIELFHRDSELEDYDNSGLLRLDLRGDYEKADVITEIWELIQESTYELFECDKIVTKVKPFADERIEAVTTMGFKQAHEVLIGDHGEELNDYYVLKKKV